VSVVRAHNDTWRRVLHEPALLAWAIYVFLIPVYVIKNGLPQPGDIFVVILLPIVLKRWNGRLMHEARKPFLALMWFTLWVILVDYTWMILTGNFRLSGPDSFMLYPMYYIYNTLLFLAAVVLYQRYGDLFLRVTVYVLIGTVFLQAATALGLRTGNRGALFFNNPNQLGYYALLTSVLIAMTHRRLQMRLVMASSAMLCCGYLAMISASRAAVGGIAILLALLFFSNPKVIIVTCLASTALILTGPLAATFEAAEYRIENRHRASQRTFFEERGYDRIAGHTQYLLLGAGEGGFSRWDDEQHVKNMELHSSAGTILFSYGVVGSLLFLMFGWRVVRRASPRLVLLLMPPLLYTIAHHGLRFTLLWILLAVFVVLKRSAAIPADPSRRSGEAPRPLDASGRVAAVRSAA
jgi:hypothetical protein